jgi:nitrite reductase (NADH) small subunit
VRYVPLVPAAELPRGDRRIVAVPGVGSVGVFNVNGSYHAIKNICPHNGAPLCKGIVAGTSVAVFGVGERPHLKQVRDGEIIRCPWHGWEFDLLTGSALTPGPYRVASYRVVVSDEVDELPGVETYPVIERSGMLLLALTP